MLYPLSSWGHRREQDGEKGTRAALKGGNKKDSVDSCGLRDVKKNVIARRLKPCPKN